MRSTCDPAKTVSTAPNSRITNIKPDCWALKTRRIVGCMKIRRQISRENANCKFRLRFSRTWEGPQHRDPPSVISTQSVMPSLSRHLPRHQQAFGQPERARHPARCTLPSVSVRWLRFRGNDPIFDQKAVTSPQNTPPGGFVFQNEPTEFSA